MELIKEIENIRESSRSDIKKAIANGNSEVQKFYDDAVIFVSGASGFLGKHLVEKILSSTNARKIYILLRPKKNKNIYQRLKMMLEDPVYEFLCKDKPEFKEKIIPIEGDLSQLNLGISEKDWSILINEVNIILHSAASINLEETVKKSAITNVRGTREILKLAKCCILLKSVVHVSTAYSHTKKSTINGELKEVFYTSPFPPEELIQLAENVKEDELDYTIKPYMSDYDNCYTFTKAVTEELVRINSEDLPLCIVRPAIIISAYREPCPGWVDVKNAFGPSGLIIGIILGVLHTFLGKSYIKLDFVPIDIVTNTTIVTAWETFRRYSIADKQTVIYTVSNERPLYFKEFIHISNASLKSLVSSKALWYCFVILTPYKLVFILLMWLLYKIPSAIVDGLCKLIGVKPKFSKISKLQNSLFHVYMFFLNNNWTFNNSNSIQLYNQLSDIDKKIYNFNMATVDLEQMIHIWVFGVKKYILNDDLQQTDYAIKKQYWLRIVHYIILPLYSIVLLSITYYFCVSIWGIFMYFNQLYK